MRTKLGIVAALALIVTVFLGFSEKMYRVEQCTATVSRYVTAEYSETSVSIDANGNTSIDTDYWSEPASEVLTMTTINGELVSRNFEGSGVSYNAYYPPIPKWDTSMSRDLDFDSFRKHTDAKVSVHIKLNNEQDWFTSPIQDNPSCINKLGSMVIVDTWYGITYDSDF